MPEAKKVAEKALSGIEKKLKFKRGMVLPDTRLGLKLRRACYEFKLTCGFAVLVGLVVISFSIVPALFVGLLVLHEWVYAFIFLVCAESPIIYKCRRKLQNEKNPEAQAAYRWECNLTTEEFKKSIKHVLAIAS